MDINLLQRIQIGIQAKRHNIFDWLKGSPPSKKAERLGPLGDQGIQSHLAVLDSTSQKIDDQSLGRCVVCHDYIDSSLLEVDYTASVCIDHLSEPQRRQLEAEIEFLQIVQQALLPQQTPDIPGLDLAAFNRPAQFVSGDFFDFFRFQDGAHGLAIADAMGHGVSASMLMGRLQTALQTLVPDIASPGEVLQRVNRLFIHNSNFTTFVTSFLCRFEPATQTLVYTNAGHNPPLLFRGKDLQAVWLMPTHAALGIQEDFSPRTDRVTLLAGDILLLYTDGVTEATNGYQDPYGRERLVELLRQNAQLSAQDLLEIVRRDLLNFTEGKPLEDDVTMLVCKIKP